MSVDPVQPGAACAVERHTYRGGLLEIHDLTLMGPAEDSHAHKEPPSFPLDKSIPPLPPSLCAFSVAVSFDTLVLILLWPSRPIAGPSSSVAKWMPDAFSLSGIFLAWAMLSGPTIYQNLMLPKFDAHGQSMGQRLNA